MLAEVFLRLPQRLGCFALFALLEKAAHHRGPKLGDVDDIVLARSTACCEPEENLLGAARVSADQSVLRFPAFPKGSVVNVVAGYSRADVGRPQVRAKRLQKRSGMRTQANEGLPVGADFCQLDQLENSIASCAPRHLPQAAA